MYRSMEPIKTQYSLPDTSSIDLNKPPIPIEDSGIYYDSSALDIKTFEQQITAPWFALDSFNIDRHNSAIGGNDLSI